MMECKEQASLSHSAANLVNPICPECGDQMLEVDRCNENGALFIWHECSRKSCDGQWLEKIPRNHKIETCGGTKRFGIVQSQGSSAVSCK